MRSASLLSTIIIWILSFFLVSLFHSYQEYLYMNQIPGFYSTLFDLLIIACILTVVSIFISFLLFIWLIYSIQRSPKSTFFLIQFNVIITLLSVGLFFIISDAAASWYEGIVYVGSYTLCFFLVINRYYIKVHAVCADLDATEDKEDTGSKRDQNGSIKVRIGENTGRSPDNGSRF